MSHLHEARAPPRHPTAAVNDYGSAAVRLDEALSADQAERQQRRTKWTRQRRFVRRWRALHDSPTMIRLTSGPVSAMAFLLLVARLLPEADGNTKGLTALGWYLGYTALRFGLGWILKRWDLWIDAMLGREGMDLGVLAEDGSG